MIDGLRSVTGLTVPSRRMEYNRVSSLMWRPYAREFLGRVLPLQFPVWAMARSNWSQFARPQDSCALALLDDVRQRIPSEDNFAAFSKASAAKAVASSLILDSLCRNLRAPIAFWGFGNALTPPRRY